MSVPARLARLLLTLAQDYGRIHPQGVLIHSQLNQTELASLIGATRESTNKALATLRREELIALEEGQIIILDPEALRRQVRE
ncbi:MAG: winged helix-turn-helix domain-containing protein [Chloroflexi bacterium]|nr:winged helix-turn-helix domain-containing protein [Chloroflexota bacterium]